MPLYQRIVRDVLTPLALWKRGDAAQLRFQREFERTQFLSPEEIRRLQLDRLRALLFHAHENCPFYRRRFEQVGFAPGLVRSLEDLRALPPLEKADIQEHGPDLIVRNWPRSDLIRNQTGGSTGTPVTFYLSGARKCSRARRRCATTAGPAGKSATSLPSSGAPRATGRPAAGGRASATPF